MTVIDIPAETKTGAWTLADEGDGIARLEFDLPGEKVNKLTASVLEDLEALLKAIGGDPSIKGLIVANGKEDSDTFIAGADIAEIRAIEDPAEAEAKAGRGQQILDLFSSIPAITLAAIHGNCLGGGTELALACDLRIASLSEKTKIGLPEVNLGIIPGFGGTQRLPRLIGIQAALPLILSGKPVDTRKAGRLGLIDRAVYPTLLIAEARAFLRHAIERGGKRKFRPRRPTRSFGTRLLEGNPIGRAIVRRVAAKGIEQKSGGHYPAPTAALDAVIGGYPLTMAAGLALEAKAVGPLIASEISKNLVQIFLTSEDVRRGGSGVAAANGERRVGILGAGVMGGGIAALTARKGYRVRLKDLQPEAIQLGLKKINDAYAALVRRRRLTASERDNLLASITTTLKSDGFGSSSIVVEAVVEKMSVKQAVFGELEEHVAEDALLCSNTSALSITEMQSKLARPERLVGLHFFNPVHRMPLIEVIPGEQTSEDATERAEAFARELGKFPVRVADRPGFLVNRILGSYLNEAAHLFSEGYSIESIDRALRRFGMPMGPFELIDEVGLDVAAKVAHTLHEAFGDRMTPAPVMTQLLDEGGLLGKKNQSGFYRYKGSTRSDPNPAALRFGGAAGRGPNADDPDLWVRRLVYSVINEAARALEEGVVASAPLLDFAMVMGTGFAPFRGGPLRYADAIGVKTVAEALRSFGIDRLAPSEALDRLARDGRQFYAQEQRDKVSAE